MKEGISDVAPAEEGGQSEGTPAQKEGVLARFFGATGSEPAGLHDPGSSVQNNA
jgi:hypothetical protein